jgi:hypothetical protein
LATARIANSNVSQLLAENQFFRMHEELGTDPGLLLYFRQEMMENHVSAVRRPAPRTAQPTTWSERSSRTTVASFLGKGYGGKAVI